MIDKLICEAINEMRLIEFTYHGNQRVVEPHSYGTDENGKDALCAFQIGGYSSTDSYDWKVFHADEMYDVKTLDKTFSTSRHGYEKGNSGMQTIYCEL